MIDEARCISCSSNRPSTMVSFKSPKKVCQFGWDVLEGSCTHQCGFSAAAPCRCMTKEEAMQSRAGSGVVVIAVGFVFCVILILCLRLANNLNLPKPVVSIACTCGCIFLAGGAFTMALGIGWLIQPPRAFGSPICTGI